MSPLASVYTISFIVACYVAVWTTMERNQFSVNKTQKTKCLRKVDVISKGTSSRVPAEVLGLFTVQPLVPCALEIKVVSPPPPLGVVCECFHKCIQNYFIKRRIKCCCFRTVEWDLCKNLLKWRTRLKAQRSSFLHNISHGSERE
jgi:hypothetical protein